MEKKRENWSMYGFKRPDEGKMWEIKDNRGHPEVTVQAKVSNREIEHNNTLKQNTLP